MDFKDLTLQINKKYGEGTALTGDTVPKCDVICTTGSYKLDFALGCGGIPEGKQIEIFGAPSGGKTSICITMMREVQKAGFGVGFIDVEQAFDSDWSRSLGLDPDNMVYVQPSSGEEALTVADMMITSGKIKLIIIDSVAALQTAAQLNADYDQAQMAQLARFMGSSVPKITAKASEHKVTVIWINQLRANIGGYGQPEVTTGGKTLPFFASVRLDVRRGDVLGDKEDPEGFVTKIKVAKNKCGAPFKKVETNLYIGKEGKFGIDQNEELISLAVDNNIIKKAGSWFSYGEERLGQGLPNAIEVIKKNPQWFEEIKTQLFTTVLKKPIAGSFDSELSKTITENEKPARKRKSQVTEEKQVTVDETKVSEAEVVEEKSESITSS